MKLAGAALLAVGALQIATSDAMAAKEKFTRNKPHVNVGSSGSTALPSGISGTTSIPDQPPDGGPEGACDAEKKTGSPGAPPPC